MLLIPPFPSMLATAVAGPVGLTPIILTNGAPRNPEAPVTVMLTTPVPVGASNGCPIVIAALLSSIVRPPPYTVARVSPAIYVAQFRYAFKVPPLKLTYPTGDAFTSSKTLAACQNPLPLRFKTDRKSA